MKKVKVFMACLMMGALTVPAWAANITIPDLVPGGGASFGGGPTGVGGEDNETEPGTTSNQDWDLEAVLLTQTTLSVVGGWNWIDGIAGHDGNADGTRLENWDSGDIFLAVDNGVPVYGSATPADWKTANGYDVIQKPFGYNYVMDMDWEALQSGATAVNYLLYAIDETAYLMSGYYHQNEEASPFRYVRGGELITEGRATITYHTTDVYGLVGGYHNEVTFQLADLNLGNWEDMWVHTVQECGNDNLMGHGTPVADGGVTVLLLGMTLSGIAAVRRKISG